MIAFALAGIAVGAILGSQFAVGALIPTIIYALTIGLGNALARDGVPGPTISELVVLLTFLQIGYLCGALLRLYSVKPEKGRRSLPL